MKWNIKVSLFMGIDAKTQAEALGKIKKHIKDNIEDSKQIRYTVNRCFPKPVKEKL